MRKGDQFNGCWTLLQVEWEHQLAAFKALLEEALDSSRSKPESGVLMRSTALVTAEIQAASPVQDAETASLEANYLGILQNALNQLQASRSCWIYLLCPRGVPPKNYFALY